ncbi:MAG: hypothetical protein M3Y39_15205 [Chloroflexota bacterium]|nr:hypothetical protein [Chloroflexota bacterium]
MQHDITDQRALPMFGLSYLFSRDGPCVHPAPYHVSAGPDGRKAHPY